MKRRLANRCFGLDIGYQQSSFGVGQRDNNGEFLFAFRFKRLGTSALISKTAIFAGMLLSTMHRQNNPIEVKKGILIKIGMNLIDSKKSSSILWRG